ncbi:winged helix-turn-helix transcriptional regulator [Micromonospora sp. NPDC003776]
MDLLAYEDLSVRASLATGVAAVRSDDEVAGRMLELLAAQPGTPVEAAADQLGVSPQRVHRALDDLVDAHLAQRDGQGDYRLPALVSDYAAELAALGHVAARKATNRRFDPLAA